MSATVAPAAPAPTRVRRDLGLLTAGTLVSAAGDQAAAVALLLELHRHGTVWVSAMLAADLLPFPLFAALAGRLVDRVDNRRLLVLSLAGQAAVAVPLGFVHSPWAVVSLVFALTTLSTVVRPATNSMVPVLAGEERAANGYAWLATGTGIGWITGPALGGALSAAFGVRAALLGDAGTFLVIAAACGLLSASRGRSVAGGSTADRSGGISVVWHDRVLRWSLLATAVAVACAVVDNVAAPFRFLDQLHASPTEYGAYLALWGIGALLGSQLPRRAPAAAVPVLLAAGNAVSGLGILGIGLAPDVAVAFAASVIGGIGNGIANVAVSALVSARVPDAQRGRVFAATSAIVQTGTGVGTVAGAPLVSALTASRAMVTAGVLAAALGAVAAAWSFGARESLRRPKPR